jgi:hypothetical protein
VSVRAVPATSWLVVGGAASIGAGAVHTAAAAAHGEHPAAAAVFTALAFAQLLWGGLALVRRDQLVGLSGVVLGVGAVGGWLLAKTLGLPVDGLQTPEPVQVADLSAATLAVLATVGAALHRRDVQLPASTLVIALTAWAVVGTLQTSGHEHAHTHGATTTAAHSHAVAVPYDPAMPIDLGGTPGVSKAQQAAAENLVAVTLSRLPQWADATVAEKRGFRSIGDGFTGTEHLINQRFLNDPTTLDPDHPESLVYDTSGGGRRLVAAMYMLKPGTPLSAVPDIGGKLVQWHTHDNLCFSPSGFVQGITDARGGCPAGQVKPVASPMVHVWITKHRCGPFAALEGIGGGTIAPGETRLCDHAHGAA